MATIADELNAISVEHGYTGAAPKTIAGAIDALADTLAGTDVEGKRTIAGAVKALAPYIGTGGGGTERVELFNETVTTAATLNGSNAAPLAYTGDITDDPLVVVFDGTEYELPKSEKTDDVGNKFVVYGATSMGPTMSDFSTYPLSIQQSRAGWKVYTETAGTHTIVAYSDSATPTPTPTLGPLQRWPRKSSVVPVVGNNLANLISQVSLQYGSQSVCSVVASVPYSSSMIASGVTIADVGIMNAQGFYAVTHDGSTYTSVRQLDVETGTSSTTGLTFVMPDLTASSETLVVVGDNTI